MSVGPIQASRPVPPSTPRLDDADPSAFITAPRFSDMLGEAFTDPIIGNGLDPTLPDISSDERAKLFNESGFFAPSVMVSAGTDLPPPVSAKAVETDLLGDNGTNLLPDERLPIVASPIAAASANRGVRSLPTGQVARPGRGDSRDLSIPIAASNAGHSDQNRRVDELPGEDRLASFRRILTSMVTGAANAARVIVRPVEGGLDVVIQTGGLDRDARERLRRQITELAARHGYAAPEIRLNGTPLQGHRHAG